MDFERLAARHKDAVYRQLVRVCGNVEDAEDALVEALLSAFTALKQLDDPDSFQAWLATIGRRACIRIKRKEDLAPIIELAERQGPLPQSPEAEALVKETKSCIARVIRELPEAYREVYFRREIQSEPAEKVARDLGISVPALKSRLHRARALVREELEKNLCLSA